MITRAVWLLLSVVVCLSDCSINPVLVSMQTAAALSAKPKSSNCAGSIISSGSICNIITADNNQNYICDKLICQGNNWDPTEGRCTLVSEPIHFTVDIHYTGVPAATTVDDLRNAFKSSLSNPTGGSLQLQNLPTTPNAQLVLSGTATGTDQARLEVVSKGMTVNAMRQLILTTYSQYSSAPNGLLSIGTVTNGPLLSYQEQATRSSTDPPQSSQSPQQSSSDGDDDDGINWLPLLIGILGGLCLLLFLYLLWRLFRKKKIEKEKSSLDGKELPFADSSHASLSPPRDAEMNGVSSGDLSSSQKKYFITAAPDVIVSRGSPTSSVQTSPLTNNGSPAWRRRGLDASMEGIDGNVTRINDPLLHL